MVSPLLLSVVLIAYPVGAWAQSSLVHMTACNFKGTDCPISSTQSGNLIVLGWLAGKQSAASVTLKRVTDNAGNLFRKASSGPVEFPHGSVIAIWYATNSLAGATSLAATANSGPANGKAIVWEFSGIDRNASPDQFQTQDWARLIASMADGKGAFASSRAATPAVSPSNACDINQDGKVDVLDGQAATNIACTSGICNGGLPEQVINAALGGSCSHSVSLTWTASTAMNVAGYNIYRSNGPDGPFAKVNSVLVSGTSYTDAKVEPGKTYHYVATTVDTAHAESGYSNAAIAVIPLP